MLLSLLSSFWVSILEFSLITDWWTHKKVAPDFLMNRISNEGIYWCKVFTSFRLKKANDFANRVSFLLLKLRVSESWHLNNCIAASLLSFICLKTLQTFLPGWFICFEAFKHVIWRLHNTVSFFLCCLKTKFKLLSKQWEK